MIKRHATLLLFFFLLSLFAIAQQPVKPSSGPRQGDVLGYALTFNSAPNTLVRVELIAHKQGTNEEVRFITELQEGQSSTSGSQLLRSDMAPGLWKFDVVEFKVRDTEKVLSTIRIPNPLGFQVSDRGEIKVPTAVTVTLTK
jgi:hypothetical protein